MGAYIMKSNTEKQLLIKEVQQEFTRTYPYLRIDFSKGKEKRAVRTLSPAVTELITTPETREQDGRARDAAQRLLWTQLGLHDDMLINEVELLLQYEFGLPAQVLRKSGNMWLETTMTQHWTLRQQNDHGFEIDKGFR